MSNDAELNTPPQTPSQDITLQPTIENIEIFELLGKGGMSLVYKARQSQLDRVVAVKVLSKLAVRGEDGVKRFQKEAKLTSTLDHPNIVKTISFGVSKDGQPYLVMEYLEGLSLADDLKINGRLNLQKFKDVFLPTLSALGHAHHSGLIHRDIKPGNIMICKTDTGAETVKLVDFGIAKFFCEGEIGNQNLTASGAVLGSPTYMSPEQCLGKSLDGRSDLYSMACVMYETLSGEPPFCGDSLLEVMQKHAVAPPPTVSDLTQRIEIPENLAKAVLWGLAKDPASRPQSASEFAKKLDEVLERLNLEQVPRLKLANKAAANAPFAVLVLTSVAALSVGAIFFVSKNKEMQARNRTVFQSPRKAQSESLANIEQQRRRALASAEGKIHTRDAPELVKYFEELADVLKKQSKYNEAELYYKRSIAAREKNAFSRDGLALSWVRYHIADCYLLEGKTDEAAVLLKKTLEVLDRDYPSAHNKIAATLVRLANCYPKERAAEAQPFLKRAVDILEMVREPNDPELATALENLALCYQQQDKWSLAEPLWLRALSITEKAVSKNDQHIDNCLTALAECYEHQGKTKQAKSLRIRVGVVENQAQH